MYNKRENITENRKTIHGVEWYRERIVKMVNQIDDEKFLNQIRIILKRHIEKRGD